MIQKENIARICTLSDFVADGEMYTQANVMLIITAWPGVLPARPYDSRVKDTRVGSQLTGASAAGVEFQPFISCKPYVGHQLLVHLRLICMLLKLHTRAQFYDLLNCSEVAAALGIASLLGRKAD